MTVLLDTFDREHVLAGWSLEPAPGSCPVCARQLERPVDGPDRRRLCRVHGYLGRPACADPDCAACPRGEAQRCGLCGGHWQAHRDGDGEPVAACSWHVGFGL